jgi:hypothetical protein
MVAPSIFTIRRGYTSPWNEPDAHQSDESPFWALSIRCFSLKSSVISLRIATQSPGVSPSVLPTSTTRVPTGASLESACVAVLFPSQMLPLAGRIAIPALLRRRSGSSIKIWLWVGPSPRSTSLLHPMVIAAKALAEGSFTR